MSDEIEIIIKGPRGAGKTVVAMAIVQLLREYAQRVEYVSNSKAWNQDVEETMRRVEVAKEMMTTCKKFVVIDRDKPIPPCGCPSHAYGCDCGGVGGDR